MHEIRSLEISNMKEYKVVKHAEKIVDAVWIEDVSYQRDVAIGKLRVVEFNPEIAPPRSQTSSEHIMLTGGVVSEITIAEDKIAEVEEDERRFRITQRHSIC